MIPFSSPYKFILSSLIVAVSLFGFFCIEFTNAHTNSHPNNGLTKAQPDSVSYYQELMDNPKSPEEFEKARSWLSQYHRALVNYEEDKIPDYDLPNPLITRDGRAVENSDDWLSVRRPEIMEIFERHVYGKVPKFDYEMTFKTRSIDREALDGTATRKQLTILFDESRPDLSIEILIYLPNHVQKPVPAVMGLNFYGNHTIHSDEGIMLSEKWILGNESLGIRNNRATEETRGITSEWWQLERIIQRGYALVTVYAGDIEPDQYNRMSQGVRSLAYQEHMEPGSDEWGTIAAWSWGLSRVMDYLELDDDIAHQQTVLMGFSRMGKAALWAGAIDERFAIIISNNSGCGGAALSKRRIGETIGMINTSFPHWFTKNFNQFNGREESLPVDQHLLLALIAPRPLYVASAEEDRWADPKGEFLSAKEASPVYELFGLEGLPATALPEINNPVMGTIGYHIRSGGHSVTAYDWENYLDFTDKFFKNK